MPRNDWSPKRERQYQHVKKSVKAQGKSENVSEEVAARTVNKARARQGESKEASPTSLDDLPSGERGGMRSHGGEKGRTYAQLYNEAKVHKVKGRSTMSKAELLKVLSH